VQWSELHILKEKKLLHPHNAITKLKKDWAEQE
jgi:hypothetical protein